MTRNDHTITRAPTLTQSVAERINDAILDGKFEPGERLVETRLSGMFGVSRAPVREALKILETTGLVRIVVGRGTFVCRLNRDELMRVVVAHSLLMGFAARLACVHGTARDVTAMNRAQRLLLRAADAGRATDVRRQEEAFLTALFDAADDTVLRQSVLGMRGQILVHRSPLTPESEILTRMGATAAEVLDSLTDGDPDRAEETARTATLLTGFAIIGQSAPPAVDAYLTRPLQRMPEEMSATA